MIHKYFLNGYYIVLDVNSGAVHSVDELTYRLLDHVESPTGETCPDGALAALGGEFAAADIEEAYQELRELKNEGTLFTEDDYRAFIDRASTVAPVKALCLHIAHDCNLRCGYCFAGTGEIGGKRSLMSLEVGKKAIDYVVEKSENRRNIEIDFFGGEPLMNFEVVKGIVKYARSLEKEKGKRFRFTVTTNGVLLDDDKMDFINKEMSNVVLSIDGRKEVNDRMRRTVAGGGSYDIIMPKFKKLADSRNQTDYYVRGTFTKYNLDFSKDVLHLADLGFEQTSVEPVVTDPKDDYAISPDDLPAVFKEYERLALAMIERREQGRRFNFFHFMIDLTQGPCVIKRLRGCGSGNEYLAVTPDGDVYPCHQFVGHEEYRMGSVLDGSIDMEIKKRFASSNLYTRKGCADCWAKFYCSGGCCANSYKYAGDIDTPYALACEMEKKRIECAVMMKVDELSGEK